MTAATGGRTGQEAAGDVEVGTVSIDSRRVVSGALFVPLVAERDGHDFIPAAVAAGAVAFLHQPGRLPVGDDVARRAVAVEVGDTMGALTELGVAARGRLQGAVVGITGSVGKTSTKDLTAAALRPCRRVVASRGSFNNQLGVPLTLLDATDETEVAVVEMGARGLGHIAQLCVVARPTMAVVTAVAAVHTEVFGGIEAVAAAKGELVEALRPDGVAVLNGDDPAVSAMAGRTAARTLRYGVAGAGTTIAGVDVVAEDVRVDDGLRPVFTARTPWGAAAVSLSVRGLHQVGNALAALSVALLDGVGIEAAVEGLRSAELSPWRMELSTSPQGAVVLNDAYNASPTSMAAALHSLRRLPAARRVAVLGVMAELGPDGAAEHRRMGDLAASLGIEVVAVGTAAYGPVPVDGVEGALAALGSPGEGAAVLIKGSRVAGLERLAARLALPAAPG